MVMDLLHSENTLRTFLNKGSYECQNRAQICMILKSGSVRRPFRAQSTLAPKAASVRLPFRAQFELRFRAPYDIPPFRLLLFSVPCVGVPTAVISK